MLNLPVTGIVHNFCTTPIYSAIINLGRGSDPIRSAGFKPTQLFTSNTNGVWYDPSDINLTWRRNLLTYTEQFDNAAWTKVNASITANAVVAPDGTLTADALIEDVQSASHYVTQSATTTSAAYTLSVFAKASSWSWVYVRIADSGNIARSVWFNVATGSIGATGVGITPTIQPLSNGWYRCNATISSAFAGSQTPRIGVSNADGTETYTGDGTSGIYIWGAQLEVGSTATPYQKITNVTQDYPTYQSQPVLFQDAAGTTPVTAVGQPVGLMLDKSKGLVLGPELVTNGGFASNLTGWSQSTANYWTWVNGRAYHANSSAYNEMVQTFTSFSKPVQIEFDYECLTAANTAQWFYVNAAGVTKSFDSAGVPKLGVGVGKMRYVALDGIQKIGFARYTQAEFYVDNISVRELPGNHAFNGSGNSANFPVLSARYNLLTKTEDFSDAAWQKILGVSVQAQKVVAPDGTLTAQRLIFPSATNGERFDQSITVPSGSGKFDIWMRGSGQIRLADTAASAETRYTLTSDWVKYSLSYTWTSAGASTARLIWRTSDAVITNLEVWSPDIRSTNDALNQPAYQRVNTATDYDTVGFKPYLSFNGVNQWLQTNSIDFTYGDKMFVSAGVRKLSDAAASVPFELSVNGDANAGTFQVNAPSGIGSNNIVWFSYGTTKVGAAASGLASPISSVMSGIGSISGPESTIRINGVQIAKSTSSQGTGNYGNYPLYIGARAGTSLWFNGRLYGLVVAGKQATSDEITNTERYLNLKTGAY